MTIVRKMKIHYLAILLALLTATIGLWGVEAQASESVLFGVKAQSSERSLGEDPEFGEINMTDTNEVLWIDRIADLPEEIRVLYDRMEEATDNDGVEDTLLGDYGASWQWKLMTIPLTLEPGEAPYGQALQLYRQYFSMVDAVTTAFQQDHPEVFWLDRIANVSYQIDPVGDGYEFSLWAEVPIRDKYRDPSVLQTWIQRRDEVVDQLMTETAAMSDYEKIRYFNQYLTENNSYGTCEAMAEYDMDVHSCISALDGRIGNDGPVCEGYACAFQVLCQAAGIPCVSVIGLASNSGGIGEAHQWNLVQMEGYWYGVDVTWNDPTIVGEPSAVSGFESEDWLLVGADTVVWGPTFRKSHDAMNALYEDTTLSNGPALCDEAYVPGAEPQKVTVTVNHWLQRVGADPSVQDAEQYKCYVRENQAKSAGAVWTPRMLSVDGFSTPEAPQIVVSPQGDVVDCYYTRQVYEVHAYSTYGFVEILGAGSYEFGALVDLQYQFEPGYGFDSMQTSLYEYEYEADETGCRFYMPAEDVVIMVQEKELPPPPPSQFYEVTVTSADTHVQVTGSGVYEEGDQVTVHWEFDPGYELGRIEADLTIGELEDGFFFEMPDQDVSIRIHSKPIVYTIEYVGVEEAVMDNPITYTIETETFTLNDPIRAGYHFLGWIGDGGDVSQMTVAIERGTMGDLEYQACWTPCFLGQFEDVNPEAWYHSSLDYVVENGLMNGTSSTTFEPAKILDRASLVTILYNISGEKATASPLQKQQWILAAEEQFTDLVYDWYKEAIGWAIAKGVTSGTGDGTTFSPAGNVTREQFVVFLQRFYIGYLGLESDASADLSGFVDGGSISSWARDGVEWGVAQGLLSGKPGAGGTVRLDPQGDATRMEATALIQRFHQKLPTQD